MPLGSFARVAGALYWPGRHTFQLDDSDDDGNSGDNDGDEENDNHGDVIIQYVNKGLVVQVAGSRG